MDLSVCIRNFSGLPFPAFKLNMERYSVFLDIQFECGKNIDYNSLSANDTDKYILPLQ